MASNAEYAINIAAEMPDGELTIQQLDELTTKLMGGGRNAEHFQQAINKVDAQLQEASRAAEAANAALAAGEQEYAQLEKAALKASKAAERAAVKNGGAVPPELAANVRSTSSALEQYRGKLRDVERAAAKANEAQTRLNKTHRNLTKLNRHVTDQLGDAATKLSTFRGALGDVGGPLGELGEKALFPVQAFVDLNEWFGSTVATGVVAAIGIAAVTAAIVALTAAAVAGVAAIAAYAVKLADAKRNADLAREALVALHPELRGASKEFRDLTNSTGVAEKRLQDLSKKLVDARVSAADMPAALRAAATAEAALGQGGADRFIADIKAGKLAVGDFTTDVQAKFGGIVARQMLGLGAQTERLRRNFSELLNGLEITPALNGMQTLTSLFDKSTVAGRALKTIFEKIFQPIIDQAQTAAYWVEAFYLGFLIGALKLYIQLKPAIQAVQEFFGFEDTSLQDTLKVVTKVGEYAAYVFAGFVAVIGVLAVAIGTVAAAGIAWYGAILTGIGYTLKFGNAIRAGLIDAIGAALEWFEALPERFGSIGGNIIQGIVNGLLGGIPVLLSAARRVAQSAVNAAKSALGIASPSKVFAEIGENTGEGFVEGVDDTTGAAQSAMTDMVAPPTPIEQASASMTPAQLGGGSAGGGGLNFAGANFQFYGVKDAEHAQRGFGDMLTRLLEGDLSQLGGSGPEGAPA